MTSSLTTVAIMFGGQSPEHEISIRSARNIYGAIDKTKFDVVLIGVSKSGTWHHLSHAEFETASSLLPEEYPQLMVVPGASRDQIQYLDKRGSFPQVEVVFPIIHGPNGEDGTLQGIFRHLQLPFVGPDVVGSAVSMDKDVAKRLLREADLLTAEYMCFHYFEKEAIDYIGVVNKLGSPLFIKPANMGSSVGVGKAVDHETFVAAVADAFRFDSKIIIEEAIVGRELECAVLGNAIPETTHIGEIKMGSGFYTYDSKYVSEDAAQTLIPAPELDTPILSKLKLIAQEAYKVLNCEGMARVDMFLTEEWQVYINEVNTLPGFTSISMYPQLWEHAGTSYSDLISELIRLAQERGARIDALDKSL